MGRSVYMAFGAVLVSLILFGCSGGSNEPAVLPPTGVEVCDDLDGTERFRYTLAQVIESPQQESPPDDSTAGDYAFKPSQPDFRFETTHDGAAVRPDRLDLEISTTPDQPTVRTIRIGENQWYLLGDAWQPATQPTPFPYTPLNICDALVSPLDLSASVADLQSVGDEETRHVRVEGAPLPASSQLFGPASDMGRLLTSYDVDLWLSKTKNRLVRVEAVSRATYPFGRELSVSFIMGVGSYNDNDIEIQPPQQG